MHNRSIALFQGQIETALKNFRGGMELRIKELFAGLHIQSHLIRAGIRKQEGFSPRHLLFVPTNLAFLHVKTVHRAAPSPPRCSLSPQAFFRYSLLAYLLEHDERSQTIGDMFRQLEEETGKLTYLERLWHYLVTFLKTVLHTLAQILRSRTPVSSLS